MSSPGAFGYCRFVAHHDVTTLAGDRTPQFDPTPGIAARLWFTCCAKDVVATLCALLLCRMCRIASGRFVVRFNTFGPVCPPSPDIGGMCPRVRIGRRVDLTSASARIFGQPDRSVQEYSALAKGGLMPWISESCSLIAQERALCKRFLCRHCWVKS